MKTIKKYITIIVLIAISLHCKSQTLESVTLEGMRLINMPFKQKDFDNKDVIYKKLCDSDLNNDGRKDVVIILDYSDAKFEDPNIAGIINKSTLICLQNNVGVYDVKSYDLRIMFGFDKTIFECSTGRFIITTDGDRYDDYAYQMEFQYIDKTFYLIRKKVIDKVAFTKNIEDVQITDKSQPIESFNLMNFFYNPYLKKRDDYYNLRNN